MVFQNCPHSTTFKTMKCSVLICVFSILFAPLYAQTDTSSLSEVIITGFYNVRPQATSINVEGYSLKELESHSPFNLSDALAKLPGISQMTTSHAISKPDRK